MPLRVFVERDYSSGSGKHFRLRWQEPVNSPEDAQALGQLINFIRHRSKLGGVVAFMGAMDIITHARTQFLIKSLQSGGITALRRLFLRADPFSNGWDGIGPGIALFSKLVNSSVEVRNFLLDFWPLLLRPLKSAFQKLETLSQNHVTLCKSLEPEDYIQKVNDDNKEVVQNQVNDPRFMLLRESLSWTRLSDYMSRLECIFMSAPDRTEESVNRIRRLNRAIDLQHVLWENMPDDLQTEHKIIPGPRLRFINFLDRLQLSYTEGTEGTHDDIAMKAGWDLQVVRLNRSTLVENIIHETSSNRLAYKKSDSAKLKRKVKLFPDEAHIKESLLSTASFTTSHRVNSEQTPTPETDDWNASMPMIMKTSDMSKHNVNDDYEYDEKCFGNAKVVHRSDTTAIASPVSRRLRQDPRQSKWFRRIVKPLVKSLCLPESQQKAAKIVYAGYETIRKKEKNNIA